MADTSVSVTPGSGAPIAVNAVGGIDYQVVKLDIGADGVSTRVPGDAANGVDVDVTRVSGNVTVVQPTATNLKVDASGVAVPITDNSGSVTVDAPVGTPVYVRLSDGTNPLTTLPVSGTATVAQGTAAAASSGWPMKLTNGTNVAGLTDLGGGNFALKVDASGGGSDPSNVVADNTTAFTEGTSKEGIIAGVYNPTRVGDIADNKTGAARITAKGDLQTSPVNSSGVEIGTAASPLYVSPATSPNSQPVTGTITAKIEDASGTAFSKTNGLPTIPAALHYTRVSKKILLSASQTGTALWTPASGNRFIITKVIVAITVAGPLTLFDGTDQEASNVIEGTQATGNREYDFGSWHWASSAINQVLKWTTGSGTVGYLTVHGYEITG